MYKRESQTDYGSRHLKADRMIFEIGGNKYKSNIGSDVQRDGMYLEVLSENDKLLGEIFYSDESGSMTFMAYQPELPLALVEWMIAHAKKRLPPSGLAATPGCTPEQE